ncbi:integrase [Telmatobacter sp. DSM 110680]|uniref:Integrase n=1 Tax=Telmatobacter sp. DSM 110680 TaxID=3036704 RepID=A0AAU7DPF0_9BACT
MAVFRYKGSKVWTMDFLFHAQRIRESTGTRSKTLALKIEDKRRRELEEGAAGIRKQRHPLLLSVAADEWLDMKKATLAPRSVKIEQANLAHLLPELGRKLICDIEAREIARYQRKRLDEEASPKTVNLEVGTLRAILKRSGQWARLQPEVKMLPTRDDIGRAISTEEEAALLQACSQSRSRSLVPFVTLAIETGARYGTIRTLQWGNVDFENRCLKWGKDKTASGTGRIVPLSQRALAALSFWATNFPERKPEHYVFPSERYGGAGDGFSLSPKAYHVDPSKPIGSIKEAWEAARLRAARILKGGTEESDANGETDLKEAVVPLACRFHDLRHTAVSRMLNAGIPIAKVAKIVGWSGSTMVLMAKRYGHFALNDLRDAVESISKGKIDAASLVFSPVSEKDGEAARPN